MQTGVIYDERMTEHYCLWDPDHNEKPERFTRILERCNELGLLKRCQQIASRKASDVELEKLHNREIVNFLKSTANITDISELEEISSKYDFLYIHPSTYELSLLAAGSSIELVSNILDGKLKNGMAIIRPPGHHAMKVEFCGYCFFNNVALAAQEALDRGYKRILIVDWDIHHGQATQQMFYEDPRVLYFSMHGYQNGAFWPHLRESDYHYIGRGKGLGYNVNVPLNVVGMGNQDYLAIFQHILLPIAHEFDPELILVSAGYDAALGCPEGEMEVTPACYSHFTSSLMGLAGGKIAVFLEGGYCLKSLAESAAMTLHTLLGDPCPAIDSLSEPCQSVKESILSVSYVLRNYWKCLDHYETFQADLTGSSENSSDIFLPKLVFVGNDEELDRYPTRGICPAQDPTVAKELDARLEELIKGTALVVSPNRLGVAFEKNLVGLNDYEIPNECLIFRGKQEGSNVDCTASSELVDAILNENCRSGIVVADDLGKAISEVFDHNTRIQRDMIRILLLDMTTKSGKLISDYFTSNSRLLTVNLFSNEKKADASTESNTINVGLPCVDDTSVLAAFFHFLMPIAYQYNPQLVFVAVSTLSNALQHVTHQLRALARGRLVMFVERENLQPTMPRAIKTLIGDPLPPLSLPHQENRNNVKKAVKNAIVSHKASWNSLAFDVKLPKQNVLVHPWVEDSKTHAMYNPEIERFHQ